MFSWIQNWNSVWWRQKPACRSCYGHSWISQTTGISQATCRRRQNSYLVHISPHSRSIGPVRKRHSSHPFGAQSSHSEDRAGWQAKMASIEFWIPWRNAHRAHDNEWLWWGLCALRQTPNLQTSSIHRMTGLGGKIVSTMTYSHRPHSKSIIWCCPCARNSESSLDVDGDEQKDFTKAFSRVSLKRLSKVFSLSPSPSFFQFKSAVENVFLKTSPWRLKKKLPAPVFRRRAWWTVIARAIQRHLQCTRKSWTLVGLELRYHQWF